MPRIRKGRTWPRRQVKIYLQRVFPPPPSPVLANIHSISAYDVPRTEDVGPPAKFRFNVGPASQPIAGSMQVNRLRGWPNTNLSMCLLYTLQTRGIHLMLFQCWPKVFDADPNNIGWLYRVFWLLHCYAGEASSPVPETPDNTIHWPNADVMLGHRLWRWANIIPTKTISVVITIFIREWIFFEHFLKYLP